MRRRTALDFVSAAVGGTIVPFPPPVDVVDTGGAGDAFTACPLHRLAVLGHLGGRLDGLDLEDLTDARAFAARVAALTCSLPGANPPDAQEAARAGDTERLLPPV